MKEFAPSSSHFLIIILDIFINYHRVINDFLHRLKTLVVVASRRRNGSDDPEENAQ